MRFTDNLYTVLQVHESAEPEVIEAAFRRLALKYHPDRNASPDATELMQRLNKAYAVLSDPGKRAAYDLQQRTGQQAEREGPQQTRQSDAEPSQQTETWKDPGSVPSEQHAQQQGDSRGQETPTDTSEDPPEWMYWVWAALCFTGFCWLAFRFEAWFGQWPMYIQLLIAGGLVVLFAFLVNIAPIIVYIYLDERNRRLSRRQ